MIAITIPASTKTTIATWVQTSSFGIPTKAIVSAMPERVTPALNGQRCRHELLSRSDAAALQRGYLWHEFGNSHLILA